jgi:hypothetical protein
MKGYDFSRSFLTFRIDILKKPPVTVSHKPPFTVNNARIQLDCRCEITDRQTGGVQEFLLGVSCKTERVGVESGIWTEPNADFVPVHTQGKYLNIKSWDHVERKVMLFPASLGVQPARQTGTWEDAFDSVKLDLCPCEAELLDTPQKIIDATLANERMMGRVQLEQGRYVAVIDFPIKTMNASERDIIYQCDTGPLLYPDLTREPADLLTGLELAFAAFNCPTWVEFLVRAPTPVAEGISVYHYSRSVHCESKNQYLRLL